MTKYEKNNLIVEMVDAMINDDWRLLDIVSNFGYSLGAVYKWITKDLQYIDDERYIQCINIMDRHKHEKMKRGGRY